MTRPWRDCYRLSVEPARGAPQERRLQPLAGGTGQPEYPAVRVRVDTRT